MINNFEFLCEHYNFNAISNKKNDKLLLWLESIFMEGKKNYFNDLFTLRDQKLKQLFENKSKNILKNHSFEILSKINI